MLLVTVNIGEIMVDGSDRLKHASVRVERSFAFAQP